MRAVIHLLLICGLWGTVLSACSTNEGDDQHSGGDADGDGDADAGQDGGGDADGDADTDTDWGGDTDNQGCAKMDILFMIDDSGSMQCEQTQLAQAFQGFVTVLEDYSNANADSIQYRLGVTTTGTTATVTYQVPGFPNITDPQRGDNGKLREFSGEPNPWLDGPDASKDIQTLFTNTAMVGSGGPSYEMPLLALQLFLEKTAAGEPNEGFLREDAVFVIVLITDEDDCSHPADERKFSVPDDACMSRPAKHNLVPLTDFVNLLNDRFGNNNYVFVTIAGATACDVSSADCPTDEDDNRGCRAAGTRLKDFTENHIGTEEGRNGVFSDLCTEPIPDALQKALDKMTVVCDEYIPPV
jgi:hypothetical protein